MINKLRSEKKALPRSIFLTVAFCMVQEFTICDNFSGGMDVIIFVISTNIPRHVAALVGGTSLVSLISGAKSRSSFCRA